MYMIIKIAEYQIKPDELEIVLEAIKEFVANIQSHELNTFYEAFRRGESYEFVHLMKFETPEAEEHHQSAEYTQKFVDILYPRCEKQPVFTDLTTISSN